MRLRDNRTQKFKFRRNSIFQKMASTLWKKKKKETKPSWRAFRDRWRHGRGPGCGSLIRYSSIEISPLLSIHQAHGITIKRAVKIRDTRGRHCTIHRVARGGGRVTRSTRKRLVERGENCVSASQWISTTFFSPFHPIPSSRGFSRRDNFYFRARSRFFLSNVVREERNDESLNRDFLF